MGIERNDVLLINRYYPLRVLLLLAGLALLNSCSDGSEPRSIQESPGLEPSALGTGADDPSPTIPLTTNLVASRADLLGLCGEPEVVCPSVEDEYGRSVRFAFIPGDSASAGPVVFFGGGPGIDFTRLAGFDPRDLLETERPIVVVGEPNSDQFPSDRCARAATAFGNSVVSEAGPGGADEPAQALVSACSNDLADYQWTEDLIDNLLFEIEAIADTEVHEVVGYSFGSRLIEAFIASDSGQGFSESSRFVFASPAPAGQTTGSDLINARAEHLARLFEQRDIAICPVGDGCAGGGIEATTAGGLIAASYALDVNEPYLSGLTELGADDPAVVVASSDLARRLVFADESGAVDAHLLRYLAIQCPAYDGWGDSSSGGRTTAFHDFLLRLHAPCESLNEELSPLPSLSQVKLTTADVCIGFSEDDPVAGGFGSRSLVEIFEEAPTVLEEFSVGLGHYPDLLHAELRGHHAQACSM